MPRRAFEIASPPLGVLLGAAFALGLAWGLPATAHAESALRLPIPKTFGEIPAATYDVDGNRIGPASVSLERLPDGHVELRASSSIANGERTLIRADLAPTADGKALHPVEQQSHSFDADGRSLGVMTIDHTARRATCAPPPGGDQPARQLTLPSEDRVANVPLNLLFQPLVTGRVHEVSFQLLTCRDGPRLFDAQAVVAGRSPDGHGGGLVEVRTDLSLGPFLSILAKPFLPRLSVWFDPKAPGSWVGYRMPLFTKGPTVLVVRSGFSAERLASTP